MSHDNRAGPSANTGVLLGFDFGQRRIGIAVGQRLTGTATALETVMATNGVPNWDRISALVEEWKPEAFVIGMPYLLNGESSHSTHAAFAFAQQMELRYKLQVHHQDERLSSREAESVIADRRSAGQMKRKEADTDQLAAQIILQNWLEKK